MRAALYLHSLRLVELLPDVGLLRQGDTDPVVVDRDLGHPILGTHTYFHGLVVARELESVAHHVGHDLLDAAGICEDRHRRRLGDPADGALGVERHLLCHRLADHADQITRLQAQGELTAVNARLVHHILHQPLHALQTLLAVLDQRALHRRATGVVLAARVRAEQGIQPASHQVGIADEAGERGPQLVGEHG